MCYLYKDGWFSPTRFICRDLVHRFDPIWVARQINTIRLAVLQPPWQMQS